MKFLILIVVIFLTKESEAITCMGCEIENATRSCNFSYECVDTEFCETLVSKVEGIYSIILSCGTMEKCGSDEMSYDEGLNNCNHLSANSECFSCCMGNKCNSLSEALEALPQDIFETESLEETLSKDEKLLNKLKKFIKKDEETIEENGGNLDELNEKDSDLVEIPTTEKTNSTATLNNTTTFNETSTTTEKPTTIEELTTILEVTEIPTKVLEENSTIAVNVTKIETTEAEDIDPENNFDGKHHALADYKSSGKIHELTIPLMIINLSFIVLRFLLSD